MVLARGQRKIVAILAQALHEVLVDHSEDEAIESAVGDFLTGSLCDDRGDLGLLPIEDVCGSFQALDGGGYAFEEERDEKLAEAHERVEALCQGQLEVDEGDVLTAGRVGRELIGLLLLEEIGGVELLRTSLRTRITDLGKLLLENGGMQLDPVVRLAPIAARAPEMYCDDNEDEGQDVELELEVIEGGALPHAVPGRVWNLADSRGRTRSCEARGGGEGRESRGRVWCACVVGEVCVPRRQLCLSAYPVPGSRVEKGRESMTQRRLPSSPPECG